MIEVCLQLRSVNVASRKTEFHAGIETGAEILAVGHSLHRMLRIDRIVGKLVQVARRHSEKGSQQKKVYFHIFHNLHHIGN